MTATIVLAIHLLLVLVTLLEAKLMTGLFGMFVPFVAVVGAVARRADARPGRVFSTSREAGGGSEPTRASASTRSAGTRGRACARRDRGRTEHTGDRLGSRRDRILYGAVGEGLGTPRVPGWSPRTSRAGSRGEDGRIRPGVPYLASTSPTSRRSGARASPRARHVNSEDVAVERPRRRPRGCRRLEARARRSLRDYAPDLVVTTSTASRISSRANRKPVISVDNIQMVDRCKHDAGILRGSAATT